MSDNSKKLVDKLTATWVSVSDDVPKASYNTLMFRGGIPEPTMLVWYDVNNKKWFRSDSGIEFEPHPDYCWLRYSHSDYPNNKF